MAVTSSPTRMRTRIAVPIIAAASVVALTLTAVPAYAATPTGSVTGKVVASDTGKPIVGANVTLWDPNGPYGYPSPVRAIQTKGDGSYTLNLTGIRSGSYDIEAGPNYGGGSAYARFERDVAGTVTAKSKLRQDFSLVRAGKISGKVSPAAADGNGQYVKLFATGANKADDGAQFGVDADGTFTTPYGVAPGTYKVQFIAPQGSGLANRFSGGSFAAASASTVTVTSGKTTTGVGTTLVGGGSVSGTVTAADTRAPLAGVSVELTSTDAAKSNRYVYWGTGYASQTGTDGSFDFTGVAPGSYTVHFETQPLSTTTTDSGSALYVPQYLGSRFTSSAKVITVAGTGAQQADVALQRGARITGTLTAAKTSLFDVRAYAKDPKTSKWVPVASKSVGQRGTSKSTTYSIPGLAPGSYKVGYRDYSTTATLPDGYYKDKTSLAGADTVTVPATGSVGKVDQALRYVFVTAATPTISGSAKVGSMLTARANTWSPTPTKFTYQWKRAGKTISKATGSKYKLTKSDKGKAITVTVTGTRSGYTTAAHTSKSVTPKS